MKRIKFVKQWTPRQPDRKEQVFAERARRLDHMIQHNYDVIYVDEVMFTKHTCELMTWSTRNQSRGEDHVACFELLLRYGADVNAIDQDGSTALNYLTAGGTTGQWVERLINAGADVRTCNITVCNRQQNTNSNIRLETTRPTTNSKHQTQTFNTSHIMSQLPSYKACPLLPATNSINTTSQVLTGNSTPSYAPSSR